VYIYILHAPAGSHPPPPPPSPSQPLFSACHWHCLPASTGTTVEKALYHLLTYTHFTVCAAKIILNRIGSANERLTIKVTYGIISTVYFNCSLVYSIIDIYAPMIYTAPYIIFLMRAYPLRGQVGEGFALEIERFLGPVKWHQADKRVPFGAQKIEISRAQPPPNCPSNGYACIQNIMHKAV
jgi:hypothetical protein